MSDVFYLWPDNARRNKLDSLVYLGRCAAEWERLGEGEQAKQVHELADRIRDGSCMAIDPYVEDPNTNVFVNTYAVERNFGGPEEGGWWYDSGVALECVPCERRNAGKIVEHLREKYADERTTTTHQGRYSVLGGADVEVRIEEDPAQSYPDRRPHYE